MLRGEVLRLKREKEFFDGVDSSGYIISFIVRIEGNSVMGVVIVYVVVGVCSVS